MAGDDTKPQMPVIPSWQRETAPPKDTDQHQKQDEQRTESSPKLDLTEHARRFLDDESIRNASREKKEAFLHEKGLSEYQIHMLLDEKTAGPGEEQDMKTVHESTSSIPEKAPTPPQTTDSPAEESQSSARVAPRIDMPPIITYPEFLLKPQKPPPLVTIDRLANAAYFFAGLSALTYGASKYLVQPMLDSLTDARHDLYATTQQSLETLNTKLESTVSHVPYIPPLHPHHTQENDTDDISVDSDPTELFHRDIATQTSPPKSRVSSFSETKTSINATSHQSTRLASLHTTLSSLLSSTQTHFAETSLSTTIADFQSIISNIESNSQPLTSPYNPYSITPSASSADFTKPIAAKYKTPDQESQATKFKSEIRALKGAFLSSRNFPTARPAMHFTLSQTQTQTQNQR